MTHRTAVQFGLQLPGANSRAQMALRPGDGVRARADLVLVRRRCDDYSRYVVQDSTSRFCSSSPIMTFTSPCSDGPVLEDSALASDKVITATFIIIESRGLKRGTARLMKGGADCSGGVASRMLLMFGWR